MKKIIAIMLTVIMTVSAIVVGSTASANSVVYKSNNCYYTLDSKGNATVINFYNDEEIRKKGGYWKIPSKLKGHTVKKLILKINEKLIPNGMLPFNKVKIPKTVTYIKNLAKSIKERGYDSDYGYQTGIFNCLIVCDEGSRAESYAKQCGLDYSIKGKIYGDMQYLTSYGFKYDFKKKDKSSKYAYMVFNGKERNLKFSIKRGKQVLKLNRDYSVKYLNNINPGLACAIIQGKGKFYGIAYIYYEIKPTKPKITVNQGKYGITVFYDNVLYEGSKEKLIVQYSETKKFKNYKTIIADNYYLTSLEKGKTYYFRCRIQTHGVIYQINNIGRKAKYSQLVFANYYYPQYSPWSDVKAVKVKYDYTNVK